jgi:hypothetical protein
VRGVIKLSPLHAIIPWLQHLYQKLYVTVCINSINRRKKMNIKLNVIITLIALFLSTSSFAGLFDEEKVEWSQVPEKVQQTINQHLQGGTIEKIEKETKKKKVIVYEAYVKKPDGKKIEIKVEEDGTLLEIEDEND